MTTGCPLSALLGVAFAVLGLACTRGAPPVTSEEPRPPPEPVAIAPDAPFAASEPDDAALLATLGAGNADADDASPDLPGRDPSPAEAGLLDASAPRTWRAVKGRHWQIVSPPGEAADVTDRAEGNRGACQPGMIEVTGNMVDAYLMDQRQQQICTKWINRKFPERCAVFDREAWLAQTKDLPRKAMHFCIDRYEYPNKKGEYPVLYVNWNEANDLCEGDGKRLCTETEWTFACEGEEAMPYPYGYVRDTDACVVDKTWVPYYPKAFLTPVGTMHELDRLWQGAASGARPRCKSPFGVYDMIGNVDEWTRSSSPKGRPSVLKGGYWGPVRTRCRPSTRAHGELHAFYQQGLRCCASVAVAEAGAGGSRP